MPVSWDCLHEGAGARPYDFRCLRSPSKDSWFAVGYWVLARLDGGGELKEFTAIEVQTIDTTGKYRDARKALKERREIVVLRRFILSPMIMRRPLQTQRMGGAYHWV